MLRGSVPPLFRKVAKQDAHRILLDFSGVEFMSRSFADEFLAAMAASKKVIELRRQPVEVRRMLKLVSRQLESAPTRTASSRDVFQDVRALSIRA